GMASSAETESSLTPVDFIQLQHYMDGEATLNWVITVVFLLFSPQCLDEGGFSHFLKTYLEVRDVPDDFCKRLFRYFKHVDHEGAGNCGVFLRDMSCYFSVLEDGQPRDKLEFTFKLYDKDMNGLLDSSEVDRIITQMMRAANYLGWDVTEIKPLLKDMMKAIDVDNSGTVTLEEWVKGGMNNIPLLMTEKDGQHIWQMKHFNKPTYCGVCESMLLGLGKQGLCCTCCKYTVHNQCANKNPEPCARTFVKSKEEIGIPVHDWIRADCKSNKCEVCHKKIKTLGGRHCVWCHEIRHDDCVVIGIKMCDCGPLRDHILPPWAIHDVSKIVPIKGTHPLLVFVNPKSGGKQGENVMRKFQYLLNPRQVYNLSNGGPAPGLQFFHNLWDYRILVCGGDGTVGWLLDALDKTNLPVHAPVAVLPLGTGNDLARCLRWGGGYEGGDLREILKVIEGSEVIRMDRWSIKVVPDDPEEVGDPVPYQIINNYFSIGVDASIAHRFHSMREKILRDLTCGGKHLDLSATTLEGIAILNIPSMHGGSNLWGESKKLEAGPNQGPEQALPEVTMDPELLKAVTQDMSDKRLEVVGLGGLAQTSQITIRTIKPLPMQIDGEPWMQPPCTVRTSVHCSPVLDLFYRAVKSTLFCLLTVYCKIRHFRYLPLLAV
uniref:Diacylglycerol kinase n=1 Tax=Neogobius melanostomus TaxID=47308 RepID=A0A8C6V3S1_9GOBI